MREIDVNDISSTPVDSGGIDLTTMISVAGTIVASFPKPADEIDGKEELNLVEDDKEFLAVKKEYKKLLY